jgi:predicted transcriptional regulator
MLMPADSSIAVKEKILGIVQTIADGGIPITRIAERAGVSVATASKFVHILAAERKVKIERFGDMKLVKGVGR